MQPFLDFCFLSPFRIMPFTFSHPALVIPLLRQKRYTWLSATGLITGSMAPDFEKFFRLQLSSHYSHTVNSIFYFSCPVALALSFIFHLLVRRPLLAHLPAPLHHRLARFARFDWLAYFQRHYVGVLASIIIGAASHLFWDSFTHQNALMVRMVPGLDSLVWIGGREMPVLEVIALLSSAGGGLVLMWGVWAMPVRPTGPVPTAAALSRYWGTAALVAAALLIEWVLAVRPRLLSVGITAISAGLIGILVASAYARYLGCSSKNRQ